MSKNKNVLPARLFCAVRNKGSRDEFIHCVEDVGNLGDLVDVGENVNVGVYELKEVKKLTVKLEMK